jgi:hypothetical protein
MLRIIRVGNLIPYESVTESIQKCIEYDFIPNSTYFTNGIFVINDKSKYSYIYEPNTKSITKCSKHEKLFIQYDECVIFKSIDSFNFLDNETEKIVWNFIKKHIETFSSNNLMCIGGDTYIYSLISYKYKDLIFMGDTNFLNDTKYNLKPYNMTHTYYDIKKCCSKSLTGKYDIIITWDIDLNILKFIENNIDNINNIIIIKHSITMENHRNHIEYTFITNFITKDTLFHHNKYDTVLVQYLVKAK